MCVYECLCMSVSVLFVCTARYVCVEVEGYFKHLFASLPISKRGN